MAPTTLDLSLGAIEIGVLLGSLLYGMSLVQTYTYAMTCQKDTIWLKTVVAAVCIFETIHSATIWLYLYNLTVSHFGNSDSLVELPWHFGIAFVTQAIACTLVQMFYVWRIFLISRRQWSLIVIPGLAASLKTGAALAATVFCEKTDTLPAFHAQYGYIVTIATVSSVTADMWNTFSLCWFLRARGTTHSHHIVNRLMLWSLETGLITGAAGILLLIFWITSPQYGLWIAALLIYSHLFFNSLLASLNARSSMHTPISTEHTFYGSQPSDGPIVFSQITHSDRVFGPRHSMSLKNPEHMETVPIPMVKYDNLPKVEYPFETT